MRRIHDWREIQRYHDLGHGFVECQRKFGFSHTAWVKAITRGSLRSADREFRDRRRRYDWAKVQRYYNEGHKYTECRNFFGFCAAAWTKAVLRGEIKPKKRGKPIPELLSTSKSRIAIKRRLLNAGLLKNECSQCGISEWLGMPLSIQVDHINGDGKDHRLENLRMLCPNCHSQTHTFGGRNAKRRRQSLQDRSEGA